MTATVQAPITGSDRHYTHVQGVPATVWTVIHNLGKRPAVAITDSGGNQVGGKVEHIDVNTVRLTFSFPFGGEAIFN